MAVQFREARIYFDRSTNVRQREKRNVNFSGRVRSYQAMLKGYNIKYNNGDHHILEQEIDLDSRLISNNVVEVYADLVLRDNGGFDDPYSGWIEFVVIADVD